MVGEVEIPHGTGDLAPDPRWGSFGTTRQTMAAAAAGMPISHDAPSSIQEMLRVARSLFIQSWWDYDLLSVCAFWAFLSLEAALINVLQLAEEDWTPPLPELAKRAAVAGLLTERASDVVAQGARLRNDFAHPRRVRSWTPGMACGALQTTHILICEMYEARRSASLGEV